MDQTANVQAIKVVDRSSRRRLGRPETTAQENKVRREIAILKKCAHPHVVKLREVIDDPMSRKIYLVLEYVSNGEIIWHTRDHEPALTLQQARQTFRDVVLGLEYLHYQGIIHRDLKPANLLWTKDHRTKISDFGVSHLSKIEGSTDDINKNELELAKTAGTPAFFAPELCYVDISKPRPIITGAIDVWALGVTLFCLLFGRCPFIADHEFELFNVIVQEPLVIPHYPPIDQEARDLLTRLLIKNPDQRITLPEVKRHPWVLNGIEDPEKWVNETDPGRYGGVVEVTAEDVDRAVSLVDRLKRQLHKLTLSFSSLAGGLRRRATTHGPAAKPLKASVESAKIRNQLRRTITSSSTEVPVSERQAVSDFMPPPTAPPSTPLTNDDDSERGSRLSRPFGSNSRRRLPRSAPAFQNLSVRSAATDVENYETSDDDSNFGSQEDEEEEDDDGFFLDVRKRTRSASMGSRLVTCLGGISKSQLDPMEEKENEDNTSLRELDESNH